MDSCSSSTNLNHSISIIYVSPVLKSIVHVSGSHITVVNGGTVPYVSLVPELSRSVRLGPCAKLSLVPMLELERRQTAAAIKPYFAKLLLHCHCLTTWLDLT